MYRALTSASVLDPIGPNSGAPRPGIRSRSRRARGSQRGVPRRNGTGSLVPRPIPRVSATPQPRRSGRRPSDGTERAQDPGGSRTAHARSRPNSNGGEVVSASSRCTSNTNGAGAGGVRHPSEPCSPRAQGAQRPGQGTHPEGGLTYRWTAPPRSRPDGARGRGRRRGPDPVRASTGAGVCRAR